jgi:23S rRNA pseudouridine1911/1915/1917 synthase
MNLDILYEDNHCLAINKPAGVPSQADASGTPSVVELAANDLKARYGKPGNVYVGLLHRLDRPASGVLLLARTSKAAARLSAQFRAGSIAKVYWAIIEGRPRESQGEWIDWLRKDRNRNRSGVVEPGARDGREARVSFRVLECWEDWCKLELRPATGRSHQLRTQLSSRGWPIVGDVKYGAKTPLSAWDGGGRIALHARELVFIHPTRGEAIAVEAPVPPDWPETSPGVLGRGCESSKPEGGPSR